MNQNIYNNFAFCFPLVLQKFPWQFVMDTFPPAIGSAVSGICGTYFTGNYEKVGCANPYYFLYITLISFSATFVTTCSDCICFLSLLTCLPLLYFCSLLRHKELLCTKTTHCLQYQFDIQQVINIHIQYQENTGNERAITEKLHSR